MTVLEEVLSRQYQRDELVDILSHYNHSIGNDELANKNILRLKEPTSVCVFTGQQLGFMGGPAYTLYKAVGCLQAAKELDAIPIFWLATEDHDIAEIDHTYTIDEQGNIQKHKLTLPSEGVVEDLVLTQENMDEIQDFYRKSGVTASKTKVKVGDSYAHVMASVLAEMFQGTGLVFMEPQLVRHQAKDLFIREIKERKNVHNLLIQATDRLKSQGKGTPITFQAGGTNVFYKGENNRRLKVIDEGSDFVIGGEHLSESELLGLLHEDPSAFSGNVALRPLVQSFIFPTVAYIGGPTEVQYFQQLVELFQYHHLPMPEIRLRPSVTCLNKLSQQYLKSARLQPSEGIPHDWAAIYPEAAGKDKKTVKSLLQAKGIPYHALHYLYNYLHPFNNRQERSLNWLWLDAQSEQPIVQELLNSHLSKSHKHHYFILNESKA